MEFNIYTEQKVKKCNEIIEFMRRLAMAISRKSFLTVYKCFERPHLFQKQARKSSYKACLIITGVIKGTTWENLYNEPGLQSLCKQRHCYKLTFFIK